MQPNGQSVLQKMFLCFVNALLKCADIIYCRENSDTWNSVEWFRMFITHLLQADPLFHWYKIPQPADLKLLSLIVRLQLILIY